MKGILTMFVRKKNIVPRQYRSYSCRENLWQDEELVTIGVTYNEGEVDNLVNEAKNGFQREITPPSAA